MEIIKEAGEARVETDGMASTRHTIDGHKRDIRILVVEDSLVNREMTLFILEKKLGYCSNAVTNGKEALETLERSDYDLVLMDCQMPLMEGYDTTRAIRNTSSTVRDHNIPIIAMTANAKVGDREKCLEAGMDDYIAKPINVKELADVIKRYLRNDSKLQSSSLQPMVKESGVPVQEASDAIYSEFADDPDLVEIIDEFVSRLGEDVRAMRQALEHGDHDGLRRLAHQMKGAGGSYGYPKLSKTAKIIEDSAKAEDLEAGTLALDKFAALCRAVVGGRG